jgi:hypothetical protein
MLTLFCEHLSPVSLALQRRFGSAVEASKNLLSPANQKFTILLEHRARSIMYCAIRGFLWGDESPSPLPDGLRTALSHPLSLVQPTGAAQSETCKTQLCALHRRKTRYLIHAPFEESQMKRLMYQSMWSGLLLLTTFISAPIAVCQVLYGTVVGIVADPDGHAVAGASVKVTDGQTGISHAQTTNANGE